MSARGGCLTFVSGDTVTRATIWPGTLYPGVASLHTTGSLLSRLASLGWLTERCRDVLSHVPLWESHDTLDGPELEPPTTTLGTERPGPGLPHQGGRGVWTNRDQTQSADTGDMIRNWEMRDYHCPVQSRLLSNLTFWQRLWPLPSSFLVSVFLPSFFLFLWLWEKLISYLNIWKTVNCWVLLSFFVNINLKSIPGRQQCL